MATITALVLTHNEEAIIARCLERLAWADEMLVVDSHSTDRTRDIARAAGARVVEHTFVDFSSQCNFGLGEAGCDWVLQIDADEMVTPKLRDSVIAAVRGYPGPDIYSVYRDAVVFGHRMKSSAWSHEWIPRLFRKGSVTFAGAVHQEPQINGREVGKLDGLLVHYTYRSVARYFDKFQLYSTLWAEKARAGGRSSGLAKASASGLWRFFHDYLIRGCIRDGRVGFLVAVLGGMHTFIRHIKLWGLEHAEEIGGMNERED